MASVKHISEDDFLNDGRVKINEFAIDPANRAEVNSKQAITDANKLGNEAKKTAKELGDRSVKIANEKGDKSLSIAEGAEKKAQKTSDELKNIVLEQSENPGKDIEVVQARGDQETLSERLDLIDSKSGNIALITNFGAEESSEDNASSFQKAIDYIYELGGGTVIIPKGTWDIVGKSETIYLKSGVSIKGESLSKTIVKISSKSGDWGSLFRNNDFLTDVEISNFTFDCNINNKVTTTDRWKDSNRVPFYVGESRRLKIHDIKVIHNGVWVVRSKSSDTEVYNLDMEFNASTYEYDEFDASSIWCGGENNNVHHNLFKVNPESKVIPATALELQGHRCLYNNNIVRATYKEDGSPISYYTGSIVTSCTSYENKHDVIQELGNNNTTYRDNYFETLKNGITIWPMNVPEGSIINGLTLDNNRIKIVGNKIDGASNCIFGYKGNIWSDIQSDADQTAPIHNMKIINNILELENRNVKESNFYGDFGIKLEMDVELSNITIDSNTIINAGSNGILLDESKQQKQPTDPIGNNEWIINTSITNNKFIDCYSPIRIARNVDGVIIDSSNIYIQTKKFTNVVDNTQTILKFEQSLYSTTKNIFFEQGKLDFPTDIKPFEPMYNQNFSVSSYSPNLGHKLEFNDDGLVQLEKVNGEFQTVPNNTYLIRSKHGQYNTPSNVYPSTVGKELKGVRVVKFIDDKTIQFNNASDIYPNMCLSFRTHFEGSAGRVISVVGNVVRFADVIKLKQGSTESQAKSVDIIYYNNLVSLN